MNRIDQFKIYIKIAFWGIIARRNFSILNVLGLTIGYTCIILISVYVYEQFTFDLYHSKKDRIYRVINVHSFGEEATSSPFPLGPALLKNYPEMIEDVVRFVNMQAPYRHFSIENKKEGVNEKRTFFADTSVFNVFDFKIVMGKKQNPLKELFTAVITESTAKRYFGDENPLGKIIKYEGRVPFKITGVIEDVPQKSHFKFDILLSFNSVYKVHGEQFKTQWIWNPCWTYVLLKNGVTKQQFEALVPNFVEKYFKEIEGDEVNLYLQPITDIHLYSHLDYEIEPNGDINNVVILFAAGLFILLIAIINYINLSTAGASYRGKETAIRKINGARRRHVFIQYLLEAIMLSFIALFLSLFVVEIALPVFSCYINYDIMNTVRFNPYSILALILLGFSVGLLTGIYPSYYLASFSPIKVLSGKYLFFIGKTTPRKLFVVFQFIVSVLLIIGTLTISKQLNYVINAELGFCYKNVIIIPSNQSPAAYEFEKFRDKLIKHPQIVDLTGLDYIIGKEYNNHQYRIEGSKIKGPDFFPTLTIRSGFFNTFKIDIIHGKQFTEIIDTLYDNDIIINEAMAAKLGWTNSEAIGKWFYPLNENDTVKSIIKNFNVRSLHNKSGPLVLNIKGTHFFRGWFTKYIAVRLIENYNKDEVNNFIKTVWKKYNPERPFDFSLLSDELTNLYEGEHILLRMMLIFTFIAMFIACIGIIGLMSHLTLKRTKEIGIRKALGAGTWQIINLMLKEFVILILIANIIAWPLAYVIINNWLDSFAYKIHLNIELFIFSAILAFGFAFLSVSYHIQKITKAKPIDALRYE